MSDDAGRRERKAFEPPPWERDQFDELAKRKAAEQALQADGATTRQEAAPSASAESATAEGAKPPGIEDAKIQAMLLELSVEGRSAAREVRQAGTVASYVLATAGVVVFGLGVVMVVQGGAQGLAGSSMIVITGIFIIGFAVWLWYRASRGQGS
jgi:hypothetical protein